MAFQFPLRLLALMAAASTASATNILFFMPFGSLSHVYSMAPLMEALSAKGHNVTLLSMHIPKQGVGNVSMLPLNSVHKLIEEAQLNYFSIRRLNISLILEITKLMGEKSCHALLTDPNFLRVVEDKGTRYDLVVMDTLFSECGLTLVGLLGSPPLVYYCTTALYSWKAWKFDVPTPFATVPSVMLALTDKMSFLGRLKNTVAHAVNLVLFNYLHYSSIQQIVDKYYPELPSLKNIENDVSLVLTNSHSQSLDFVRPLAPFVIEVGGTHCRPPKPLPKDLEDFVNGSGEHGFIFFSLGSHIPGTGMPSKKRSMFLNAFGRLKQRVLWKFDEDLADLPPNVLIRQWAPQQDLLGHPKIKVFITHGGQLSLQEAVYHGVPILGMSIMADQLQNIKNVVEKGLAEEVDYDELDEDDIYEKLMQLVSDPSYKAQSMKYASLMRDRPMDALQSAVYWTEYVIRHRGALHLRLQTSNLNFFQYFLLDVFAALIVIAYVLYLLGKAFYMKFLSRRTGSDFQKVKRS